MPDPPPPSDPARPAALRAHGEARDDAPSDRAGEPDGPQGPAAETAARLQIALDAAQMGRWEADLEAGGVVQDARARALHGLPPGDAPTPYAEVQATVHPDDRRRMDAAYRAIAERGGDLDATYRTLRADGGTLHLRATGRVIGAGPAARLVGVVQDVTERQEAEARLRTSAASAAFRNTLGDVLAPLGDPAAIQAEAARVLGLHLGASRVFYSQVDGDHVVVECDYRAGVPSVVGRHRVADFGPAVEQALRTGRTLAVPDVAAEPGLAEPERAAYRAVGVGAHVEVPLVKGGRLVALLTVHQDAPRAWDAAEVALVEEAAERTWAAVERARAEAALRESEARLRLATEAAGLGVFAWTPDGDLISWENSRIYEIFGFDPSEPPLNAARFADEVVHPGDAPALRAAAAETLAHGAPFHFEGRFARADGAERWVEFIGRPVLGPDGAVRQLLGTAADVTERREAGAALRESEERYRTLFDSVTVGFCIVDLVYDEAGRPVDYRYVETNPTFEAQTGLSDVEGRCVSEVAPGLEPYWFEMFGGVAETGAPARRLDHAAPLGRWFDVYAARVGGAESRRVALLFTDVTDQKESEAALRESEERFRATFENAAVGIAHVGLDGSWLRVNRRLSEILGYTRDELLARTFQDITHPADLGADLALFERLLAGEVDHYQLEKRYVHRGGHAVWINLTVALATDAGGVPTHAISVVEDVSDKKAAEAELVALNAVLEDRIEDRTAELARSNDELDRFAYVASHDLKAPIRAIDSLAAWIEEDAGPVLPEASAEHLRLLRGRTERMEGLLDGLLAYSRAGRGEAAAEPVDVADLVAEAVETVAPPQGFDVVVAPDPPTVTTARAPLALVVRNLIGNAIKHHDRPDGRVTVAARVEGDRLAVEVADDGPGIAPEYQARVFEMFQTLRPRDEVEGSGMGLAIVKKTVESRGGRVTVASRGRGTTFEVLWPLGGGV